jgi:tRNA A37 N6-isopentenylltransferase MiaA
MAFAGTLAHIEVEDTGVATLKWRNGAMGTLNVTMLIKSLMNSGKTPIVVGGTGLYLMALTEGLSEIPPIPEAARTEARARVAADVGAAFAELASTDPPARDRIDPQDRQRIARALEVLIAMYMSARDGRRVSLPLQY